MEDVPTLKSVHKVCPRCGHKWEGPVFDVKTVQTNEDGRVVTDCDVCITAYENRLKSARPVQINKPIPLRELQKPEEVEDWGAA